MHKEIMYILIMLLGLFCLAELLVIIRLLKRRNNYNFYFKKGTRLYNLAFRDDLTGLFNRNAYIRDLAKMKKKNVKNLWFLLFDIDDFKTMNDTEGHLFGDGILVSAAERLNEVFEEKDHTVYRIGGDEFLVISRNISETELVDLLIKLRKEEREKGDFRFSKGYSRVEGFGNENFDEAFDNADKMLYADKNSKKTDKSVRL